MEKSWQVKTNGKSALLFIVFIGSLLAYVLLIVYAQENSRGQIDGAYFDNFMDSFWGLFFFFVVWLIAVFPIIIKRKIPLKMVLNDNALELRFSNNIKKDKIHFINKFNLAYSFNDGYFSRFIIYQKIKSHSGRWAYVKVSKIIALPFGWSWTNKRLKNMAEDFKLLDIEFRPQKKDLVSDFLD